MNSVSTRERPPVTGQDQPSDVTREADIGPSRLERGLVWSGVAAALVGTVLFIYTAVTASPSVSLETTAESGQFSARLDYFEWLSHDHSRHSHDDDESEAPFDGNSDLNPQAQEGFARPASMMPGTPDEGFQRLQIELHMQNSGGPAEEVSPADFWLEDSEGRQWPGMAGGTFRPVVLASGQALNTVLAFDVEDNRSEDDMELVWLWDGVETRFVVTGSDHH